MATAIVSGTVIVLTLKERLMKRTKAIVIETLMSRHKTTTGMKAMELLASVIKRTTMGADMAIIISQI